MVFSMKELRTYIVCVVMIMSMLPALQSPNGSAWAAHSSRSRTIDFDNATVMDVGDSVNGVLDENSNYDDCYKVKLNEGDVINFNLSVPLPSDFDMRIYNSLENSVAHSAGMGAYEDIDLPVHLTGFYYVLVFAYEGSGNYELSVTLDGTFTSDGDNSPEEATPMALNSSETSDLDEEGYDKFDWWNISLEVGDIITISLTVPNSGNFDIVLLDVELDVIANSDENDPGEDEEAEGVILFTSNYYIVVYAEEGSGTYTLTVTKTGHFTSDNNNDAGNATAIQLGDTIENRLTETIDRMDWFFVNLTEGDIVRIHLTIPPATDFDVVVYDAELDYIDDSSGSGQEEEINIPIFSSGTYYMKVISYRGSGSYVLTVTKTSSFTPDGDDTWENATVMSANDTVSSGLSAETYDYEDWWTLTLNAGDIIDINVSLERNNYLELTLYDQNLDRMVREYVYGNVDYLRIEAGISLTGDYYINCHTYDDAFDYTMRIERTGRFVPDGNNDAGNATSLLLNSTVTDSLRENVDYLDYYSIPLNMGNMILIELEVPDEADYVIVLGYGTNDRVSFFTDSDSGGLGEDELLLLSAFQTGTYYILVYANEGRGDYTLSVFYEIPDDNNAFEDADELGLMFEDIVLFGLLSDDSDSRDVFRFSLEELDTVHISLDYNENNYFAFYVVDAEIEETWDGSGEDGHLELELTAGYTGFYYIVLRSYYRTGRYTLRLNYTSGNYLPEIDSIFPEENIPVLDEGEDLTFRIEASDPDGTTPFFRWFVDGEEVPDHDETEYKFTTNHSSAGTYVVKVMIIDEEDERLYVSRNWILTVKNVDRKPVLENPTAPNPVTDEETPLSFHVDAEDPDGEIVTYKWYVDGERVQYADGIDFIFEPDYTSGNGAPHNITVVVRGGSGETIHSWSVTVSNINRPPVIDVSRVIPARDSRFNADNGIDFNASATDPDGDNISYEWTIRETGKSFLEQGFRHKLEGGSYTIRVKASDGNGGEDVYEFVIHATDSSEGIPGFNISILIIAMAVICGWNASRSCMPRRVSTKRTMPTVPPVQREPKIPSPQLLPGHRPRQ